MTNLYTHVEDELTDSLPPHGPLWAHTLNALNFMEANLELEGIESPVIEIRPDDELKIEMLARRFLRRIREQDQNAFRDTLTSDFRHHLSTQHLKPTVWFLKDMAFLAKRFIFFEAQEFGLSDLGLFRRIEITLENRMKVNINFFVELDEHGEWHVACIQTVP